MKSQTTVKRKQKKDLISATSESYTSVSLINDEQWIKLLLFLHELLLSQHLYIYIYIYIYELFHNNSDCLQNDILVVN